MPEPPSLLQPSLPQPSRPRRRIGLWAPYAAVLVALLAWSVFWWTESMRVHGSLADAAARLRAKGYAVSWSALTVDGWPFRLRVTVIEPRVSEASGWSATAPDLKAEAMAYGPDHWVVAAPDGLTLTRPGKGSLSILGQAIRGSVTGLGSPERRYSFEALKLTLSPAPGAQPAPILTADRLELHLQPGPGDQAALLLRLEGAALAPSSALGRLVPHGGFGLIWDSRLSHLSAISGPSWSAALQHWTAAGGAMTVADGRIALGPVGLKGSGGPLTVGPDGRLRGTLPLRLDGGKGMLSGLGAFIYGGPLDLKFQDGRAALGLVPLGAAMKVG